MCHCAVAADAAVAAAAAADAVAAAAAAAAVDTPVAAAAANSSVSGFAVLGTVFRRSSGEACSFGRLLAG